MIPVKSEADFWIQIIAGSDPYFYNHDVLTAHKIIDILMDAPVRSAERYVDRTMYGDGVVQDFNGVILRGELETIGVFTFEEDDTDVGMIFERFADGFIVMGSSEIAQPRIFGRPARTFSAYNFTAEAHERWPEYSGQLALFDIAQKVPMNFEDRFGIADDKFNDALYGRNAAYFLTGGEMLNSPFHLIYAIVAEAESESLHARAARAIVASRAFAYRQTAEEQVADINFVRDLIRRRPKLYEFERPPMK